MFYNTSDGLPCGHDLASYARSSAPVPLTDVHRHWWFDPLNTTHEPNDTIRPILDPLTITSRRLAAGTSTRREPSQWERIDDVLLEQDQPAASSRSRKRARPVADEGQHDDDPCSGSATTNEPQRGKSMSSVPDEFLSDSYRTDDSLEAESTSSGPRSSR